jgi:glycosyltransferase involved in cell wall biosynthesis
VQAGQPPACARDQTERIRLGLVKPALLWINQFAVLPRDGGGTRHFELGRELVRRGWAVTLFASDFHLHKRGYTRRRDASARAPVVETLDGVDIHWLWAAPYEVNNWRRAWNWLTFARSVRGAGRALERPDVVIGSSPQLFGARAAAAVAATHRTPFVFEVRDLWPESLLAAGGAPGIAYRVMDRVAGNLYAAANRIIVLARGTGDYLEQKKGVSGTKIVHIPNGVDVDAVQPRDGVASPSRPFTLIYAGAHGPANGLHAVLEAAEQPAIRGGVRFVLVGDGPAKADLQQRAASRGLDNVEFRPSVGKEQLVSMFHDADAGLMLLRDAELFSFAVSPNKLFDYTAAALPVICNVRGEVAQMVKSAGAGVQARDSSGIALAEAIADLLRRPAVEREAMGRSGREWVEREHSRSVLGQRMDRMLRELLQR